MDSGCDSRTTANLSDEAKAREFVEKLRPGLLEMLRALEYAKLSRRDLWQFAIEFDRLRELGLTKCDLRWLVCMGHIEHALEATTPEQAEHDDRQFQPSHPLLFSERSSFVLTTRGTWFSRAVVNRTNQIKLDSSPDNQPEQVKVSHSAHAAAIGPPIWDNQRNELRLNGTLIKRFKWPAVNQQMILAAFQEERWPPRIDDPLPPRPEFDPKRRLHDTIKSLNRNLKASLIHFRGDGTGEGVLWELSGTNGGQHS